MGQHCSSIPDDKPPFFLYEKEGLLHDFSRQSEYRVYRVRYKELYGTFPEMDQINKPIVALPLDDAFWPPSIKRLPEIGNVLKSFMDRGIMDSGIQYSILYNYKIYSSSKLLKEFEVRFRSLVGRYMYLYGLACSDDCIPALDTLLSDSHIVNRLGYYYDREKGMYYEGTWAKDKLIYGMVLHVESNVILFGSFSEGAFCEGVVRTNNCIYCGYFEDAGLECQEGLTLDIDTGVVFLGPHRENVVDGIAIAMDMKSGCIIKQQYVMGNCLKGIRGFLGRINAKIDTWKRNRV